MDKRRNHHLKRILAFVLCAVMVITYMPAYMNAYAVADGTDRTAVQGTTVLDAAGSDRTAAGAESGAPADTASQENTGKEETAPGSGDKAAGQENKTDSAAAKTDPAKPEKDSGDKKDAAAEQNGSADNKESAEDKKDPSGNEKDPAGDKKDSAGNEKESGAETEDSAAKSNDLVLSAVGSSYNVTVTCSSISGIPEGATLEVTELSGGQYNKYLEKTADALEKDKESISYVKLLDISIVHDGSKIQPEGGVDVSIQVKDADLDDNREDISVVHFGDRTEVIDASVSSDNNKVSFETDGFSIYAITSTPVTNLDGKTLAIVHASTAALSNSNKQRFIGQALKDAASGTGRLGAENVVVENHEGETDLVSSTTAGEAQPDSTAGVVKWTFEAAGAADTYYIKTGEAGSEQYLNISGNNNVTLSGTPQALTVKQGTGANSSYVSISSGTSYLRSSVARTAATNPASAYFTSGTQNDNTQWMTLCEVSEVERGDVVYSGEKISVQNLVDGGE